MTRTRRCTAATIDGRRRKAEQFMEQAQRMLADAADPEMVGDAYVTLCAHAGIAAADVLCCRALGEHAQGESHQEAVALVGRVGHEGAQHAKALDTLLSMKTRAGYSPESVSADQRMRAGRAARQLVDALRI